MYTSRLPSLLRRNLHAIAPRYDDFGNVKSHRYPITSTGHLPLIKYLYKNITGIDRWYCVRTDMRHAIDTDSRKVFWFLHSQFLPLVTREYDGRMLVHSIINRGRVELLRTYLETYPECLSYIKSDGTAISIAMACLEVEVLRYLISIGASITAKETLELRGFMLGYTTAEEAEIQHVRALLFPIITELHRQYPDRVSADAAKYLAGEYRRIEYAEIDDCGEMVNSDEESDKN